MEKVNADRLLVESREENIPLGRPNMGGWLILSWTLQRQDRMVWSGCVWLRIGSSGGLFLTW
jgi:hypothetical protein